MLSGLRGMNSLACAGDSDCGCGCKDKGMSGLAATTRRMPQTPRRMPVTRARPMPRQHNVHGLGASDQTQASIMSILDGTTLQQIKQMYSDYQDNAAALDKSKAAIDAMPMSDDKLKAIVLQSQGEDALRQQFVIYRQLRDDYNSFVTQASPYTLGMWNPGLAGFRGMGALGVIPQAVLVIAGIVALAFLADKIAEAIAAGQGKDIATKGYIDQLADLTKAGTGLIGTLTTTAIVGGIAFVAFKLAQSKGWIKV